MIDRVFGVHIIFFLAILLLSRYLTWKWYEVLLIMVFCVMHDVMYLWPLGLSGVMVVAGFIQITLLHKFLKNI